MPKQPDCAACNAPHFDRPCFDHVAMVDIATIDELWGFMKRWMDQQRAAPRAKARRLLIRRLSHPETVGLGRPGPPHIEKESRIHPRQGGDPRLRRPVRCQCGDTLYAHDEDTGECTLCVCPMFSNTPS